jgi:hypothetical protein
MTHSRPSAAPLPRLLALAVGALLVVGLAAAPAHAARKRGRAKRAPKRIAFLTPLEQAVWQEFAALRQAPRKYAAAALEPLRGAYAGKHFKLAGDTVLVTNEGVAGLDGALADLRGGKKRLRKLKLSKGMSLAARDHVLDIGKTGSTDHAGADGDTAGARLSRYGEWEHRNAELLSFGWGEAAQIVAWLLIDDGAPGHGQRKQLLADRWRFGGLACGTHAEHEHVCVILLADKYRDANKKVTARTKQLRVYVTE